MGHQRVYAQAAQLSQDTCMKTEWDFVASYRVIQFTGITLPAQYASMVYSKWLRSLRYGNDFFKLIEPDAYYSVYKRYIHNVLRKPDTSVRIAVLTDDADVALGFSIFQEPVLHYVHVHKDNRKLGIGRNLIPPGITTITHVTKTGLSIWGSKYSDWKFNPFV